MKNRNNLRQEMFVEEYISKLAEGINWLKINFNSDYCIFNKIYSETKDNLLEIKSQMFTEGITATELETEQVLNLEAALLKLNVDRIVRIFGEQKVA